MQEYPHSTSLQYLVLEDDIGVNGPIIHQSAIARITADLYPLYRSGSIPFEPLPETMLTEGYASPVPDVILYDHQAEQTRVVIEVCKTAGLKHDTSKIVKLIEDENYGILEGFVFNYKTNAWLRYRKGDGGLTSVTSFSEVLNLDLNLFL